MRHVLLVFFALMATSVHAADPVAEMYLNQVKLVENDVLSLARAMPADKYDFAPTAGAFTGVRTFGQQVKHLSTMIFMTAAIVLEERSPYGPGTNDNGPDTVRSKEEILQLLAGFAGLRAQGDVVADDGKPSRSGQDLLRIDGQGGRRFGRDVPQLQPLWANGGVCAHERHRPSIQPTDSGGAMTLHAAIRLTVIVAPFLIACSQRTPEAPINMEFVRIEPGTFTMGCPPGNIVCDGDERPAHQVRITKGFEIGKFEVTQAQWKIVMGTEPSNFKGEMLPVEQVSWDDVGTFMERMNARKDGYRYRLPTEAEWEYAARAGATEMHHGVPDEIAWFMENSNGVTHPVGSKAPNAWGLHDTQGNVYEFVQDWFGPYANEAATDPTGPGNGSERLPRGGSWMSTIRGIRLPNRNLIEPGEADFNIGFRCVREPVQ